MRFTSDFWIKKQDASDIKAGTFDGMATELNLRIISEIGPSFSPNPDAVVTPSCRNPLQVFQERP